MNTKFRNILFSTMLGVAGLATTGCTDLDEHLYDTIATETMSLPMRKSWLCSVPYIAVCVMYIGDGIVMPI